jgi:hypothetical protein
MMELSPLGTCLTALHPELIRADPNHFLNLGANAIPPAHLGGRQPQAIGGVGLLAISDHEYVQPPLSWPISAQ